MNLIQLENIAHSFGESLFEKINLSIKSKQCVAIMGESGSGKSTLLHIAAALLEPNEGHVALFNQNIYNLKQNQLEKIRREKIAMIFQNHYLFKGFTAEENLEAGALIANKPINKNLLKILKIDNVLKQKITNLSGGQQQRVSIAMALNKRPKIIFADEPTGNLDDKTSQEIMQLFKNYTCENEGCTLIVTHSKKMASYCDAIFELANKKLQSAQF